MKIIMTLYCPFCHCMEHERVVAEDGDGKKVVLVMFDCPFFIRVEPENFVSEDAAQTFLNSWKEEHGDDWLESIGPMLRDRELKNIHEFEGKKAAS